MSISAGSSGSGVGFTAPGGGEAPGAPTNLAVAVGSDTALNLTWSLSGSNETSVEVEARDFDDTWSAITGSPFAATTEAASDTVTANVCRSYRVRATNGTGSSSYTSIVQNATTEAATISIQDLDWQRELRGWMKQNVEADFSHSNTTPAFDSDDYSSNLDILFKFWISMSDSFGEAGALNSIKFEDKWFVLDAGASNGIEGSGTRKIIRDDSDSGSIAHAALFLLYDYPGNPYRSGGTAADRAALIKRTMVQVCNDMLGLAEHHDGGGTTRSDFLGGQVRPWAFAYKLCKAEIPANLVLSLEKAFEHFVDIFIAQGPTDVNTNMDTRTIPSFAYLYNNVDDATLKTKCEEQLSLWVGGSTGWDEDVDNVNADIGVFHSAGYVGESDGPETTYNGVSFHHVIEAAFELYGVTGFDYMQTVAQRMSDFRQYQMLPDIEGVTGLGGMYWTGPSAYAKRTADAYVLDQGQQLWRHFAEAAVNGLSGSGYGLAQLRSKKYTSHDPPRVWWNESNPEAEMHGAISVPSFAEVATTPPNWSEDHWHENWPFTYENWDTITGGSIYSTWLGYFNPSYTSDIGVPYTKAATLNKSLGDEFWSHMLNDGAEKVAWIVEAVPDAGGQYGDGYQGGGSLQGFWTEGGGIFILARGNKWSGVTMNWSNIENWAAHHVWGTIGSNGFSSARQQETKNTTFTLGGSPPTVTVDGELMRDTSDDWTGVDFENKFEVVASTGLKVTHTVTRDASQTADELMVTIPAYINSGRQSNITLAVDFYISSVWTTATSSYVSATAIRLQRDGGTFGPEYLYIEFDQAYDMKITSSVWSQDYQSEGIDVQPIHIRFWGDGTTQTLDASSSINYTISRTAP